MTNASKVRIRHVGRLTERPLCLCAWESSGRGVRKFPRQLEAKVRHGYRQTFRAKFKGKTNTQRKEARRLKRCGEALPERASGDRRRSEKESTCPTCYRFNLTRSSKRRKRRCVYFKLRTYLSGFFPTLSLCVL